MTTLNRGYLEIDQAALNHVLGRVVASRDELAELALELEDGRFALTAGVRKFLRVRVRLEFEILAVKLTTPDPSLRLRKCGATELGQQASLMNFLSRTVVDPLSLLVRYLPHVTLEDDVLEVDLSAPPVREVLETEFMGGLPEEWFPLVDVECREGQLRLWLETEGPGGEQSPREA